MDGAHYGDSSGKASCNSGSEEEKDSVVLQSSDVPKKEITGAQVINEEKMDDSPVAVVDAMGQTVKEENSSGVDAEKNLAESACETLTTCVAVDKQENDSQVKTGVSVVDAVEPLNFDDFNSAKEMEVCMVIFDKFK